MTLVPLLRRFGLLLAVVPPLLASPGRADDPPIELRWTAGPSCPDAASVLARVRALAGPDTPRKIRATAAVQQGRGGFRVRLLTEIDGHRGERSLEASSCASLAEATALVLALMINPEASLALASSSSPVAPSAPPVASSPPSTPAAPPVASSAPALVSAPPVASSAPAASSASAPAPPPAPTAAPAPGPPWVASARALFVLDGGWAPGVGPGAAVGLWVRRGGWSAGLDLSWAAARSREVVAGKGGDFSALGAALRGCYGPSRAGWSLAGCGVLDESRLESAGIGISEPASAHHWVLALGLGGEASVRLTGPLWLEGGVDALVSARRYTFSIEELGRVYKTPSFGGRARLGLGLHF